MQEDSLGYLLPIGEINPIGFTCLKCKRIDYSQENVSHLRDAKNCS